MSKTTYKEIADTDWFTAGSGSDVIKEACAWDSARSLRRIASSLEILTAPFRQEREAVEEIRVEMQEVMRKVVADVATMAREVTSHNKRESRTDRLHREDLEECEEALQVYWDAYIQTCAERKRVRAKIARLRRDLNRPREGWTPHTLTDAKKDILEEIDTNQRTLRKVDQRVMSCARNAFPIGGVFLRPWGSGEVKFTVSGHDDTHPGTILGSGGTSSRTKKMVAHLKGARPLMCEFPTDVVAEVLRVSREDTASS